MSRFFFLSLWPLEFCCNLWLFFGYFFFNYWKTPNMSLIKKEYVKSTFYLLDE